MATVYEKDGEYRVATRVRDEVRLEWDGWKRSEKTADEVEAEKGQAPESGPVELTSPVSPQVATNQARAAEGEKRVAAKNAAKQDDMEADADAQAAAAREGVDSPETKKA